MPTFSETYPSITLADIQRVEQLTEMPFSKEYKQHLLKHNGGQVLPNIFSFNEHGTMTESTVRLFLAIGGSDYDDLEEHISTYKIEKKRIPDRMIPIAYDDGGNLVCISCKGEDIGYIYFWDHEKEEEYEVEGEADAPNIHIIAKDFNSFLDNLTEDFRY